MPTVEYVDSRTSTSFERVLVTPELAAVWLATANTRNRPRSRRRVAQMATDMAHGNWGETPDLIAFDSEGVLVNGQHRLEAVVISGARIPMWIMKGLAPESFHVTDDVKRRTFADYLGVIGVPSHSSVAALVQRICIYDATGAIAISHKFHRATTSELIALYERLDHEALATAVRRGDRIRHATRCSGAGAVFAAWLIATVDEDDVDPFIEEVTKGRHQGLVFRDTMLRDRASTRTVISKDAETTAAYLLKTWNAWRRGDDLKLIRWRRGGGSPEAFPTPL